ncbi:MAG: type II 3-dehydroquinate dehydratase [Bdellovibrionales bacterium]|nr:type II 3-dehydroquinate dehydratase [Bdellovibrionales bacterium]
MAKIEKILVLHGPNLNLLGERLPEVYGHLTLAEIDARLHEEARLLGFSLSIFQSNHEGQLIDHIHEQRKICDAIIINPAGLTHTSVVLRDALEAVNKPIVEVHLSNIEQREDFRRHSYVKDISLAQISGLGWKSYIEALRLLKGKSS